MKPSDFQLLALLRQQGVEISPEEYDAFLEELKMKRAIQPGEGPQAGLEILAITFFVLSVGLTIAASFFKPKPTTPGSGGIVSRDKVGDSIRKPASFAPRYGFDSIQDPAVMGSPVPLIYTNRRERPPYAGEIGSIAPGWAAGNYPNWNKIPLNIGGIRVNMPLLFSQVKNVKGTLYLRAIFLLGEGSIYQLDCDCFAIGNTSLQGLELPITTTNLDGLFFQLFPNNIGMDAGGRLRRYSVYFRRYGGRIVSTDYIRGRVADFDPANHVNEGAADVYQVRGTNNEFFPITCFSQKPSTNATFGLYNHIPNNFACRISPRVRPTITLRTEPDGDDGGFRVRVDDDPQALAEFWKSKYFWSGRAGLRAAYGSAGAVFWGEPTEGGSVSSSVSGRLFIYMLSSRSDETTRIHFDQKNTDGEKADVDANLKCGDVAGIVSGRQRAADTALILGESYKIGGMICVLVGRSSTLPAGPSDPDTLFADYQEPFVSDSDETPGNGRDIYYTFMNLIGGSIGPDEDAYISEEEMLQPDRTGDQVDPPEYKRSDNISDLDSGPMFGNASNTPQIFRIAMATITTPRATNCVEIGIRSTLGITISGYTNFRDCETLKEINDKAGNKYNGDSFDKDEKVNVQNFTSGTISSVEGRFSFWRIWIGTEAEQPRKKDGVIFMVRGYGGQPTYNQLRMTFSEVYRYDIIFEPLSAWEVRSSAESPSAGQVKVAWLDSTGAGGQLVILPGDIGCYFRGRVLTADQLPGFMRISAIEPKKDIGYGYADGKSMCDAWAAAAEAFIYPEITTTAEQGPEHEIVYVNCINAAVGSSPEYDKLSIIGLNIQASADWSQFSQFSTYVSGGRTVSKLIDVVTLQPILSPTSAIGPTNLFPEILYDILLNPTFGTGEFISSAQVDRESFCYATLWCERRGYYCDIAITERSNLRQWAADMAAMMLLELTQKNGKFALQPALVFDAAVPISGLFTAGNIVENSFALEYLERDDREPIQVSVKWRHERAASYALAGNTAGFFAEERTVLVREAGTSQSAPIESFDMSDYCTNLTHAIDVACYVIRVRRLITHSIRFRCTPDSLTAALGAGDYIRVAMDTTFYDEFANGVILADGTVVTTKPDLIGAGSNPATVWDGSTNPPTDATLTISPEGVCTSHSNVVFVRKNSVSQVRTYKIESLTLTPEMELEIEAVEHPTDSNGISLLSKNWPQTYETDTNWVIDAG